MIIEKGVEYDEIVNQMEQVKVERDSIKRLLILYHNIIVC